MQKRMITRLLHCKCAGKKGSNNYYIISTMNNNKFTRAPLKPHIQMRLSTWNKDSHGLYDYESMPQNYKKEVFYIEASAQIYKDRRQPIFNLLSLNEVNTAKESQVPIAKICIDRKSVNNPFKLQPNMLIESQQSQFDITRTFYKAIRQNNPENSTSEGFPLRPGNVIKLGRVEYMVIQMKTNSDVFTCRGTNHFKEVNGICVIEKKVVQQNKQKVDEQNQVKCKVCLCNEETEYDPLISPCACSGSVALIHVGCLKQWINSKVKRQINDIATSYNFTKFECQICKYPFPKIVMVENNPIEMMTINKPDKPYIIIESLNKNNLDGGKEERCLHLIAAKQNAPIRIGRGHQCEIRLTDISVSRSHAQIIFKGDQFYIKDQKSKFGTLIKLEQSIDFPREEVVKVQVGRTLIEFELRNLAQEVDTDE